MTRERVRQLIARHGASRTSGGRHRVLAERLAAKQASAEARCFARWGCSLADLREMRAAGVPRAYGNQREAAKARGIEWRLSMIQWWRLWKQSGRWEQRGRKTGQFVMSRINDSGPYEIGNVHVQTCNENGRDATKKWIGKQKRLPRGVFDMYPGTSRRYVVMLKRKRVGRFATVDEAAACVARERAAQAVDCAVSRARPQLSTALA
jgi:hypothetical protein